MKMRKILAILFCLCTLAFAESREMRIGDSQYFNNPTTGKMTKVTLVGVQNGVAILKKEDVENPVESINYYYMAPTAPTVAPISLQPYPETVYDTKIKIRGISEPNQNIVVWKAGADKVFDTAVKDLTANVVYDGSSFSVELPLDMGDNTYFLSYEEGVVGNRAEVDVKRIDPPSDLLSVDLDPIGSSNLRKTNMIVANAKYGSIIAYESVLSTRTVKTTQNVEQDGNFLLSANNTLVESTERSFDISLHDYNESLVASGFIVVPVSEATPECQMTYDSPNFTPTHSLTGSFKAPEGVRFVWSRVLDYRGFEYSRSYFDLEKMEEGNFSIHYDDLKNLKFKVYDKGFGLIRENSLPLPDEQIKSGDQFYLEIGVTNIAGNRSNTYLLNLFEAEFEKIIDISLMDAVPTEDLYNYPVLVKLDRQNFVFNKSLESGDDISFTDIGGQKLDVEKERFSRDEYKGEFWVKIPVVHANSTRIRVKVRWGNPLAEPYDGASVWNESFKGVYHFNEEQRGPYVIPNKQYYNNVVYTTGDLVIGERSVLNGSYQSNGSEELAVEPLPIPGTQNVAVQSGSAISLAPGSYGDFTVGTNSVVNMSAGTYHFKSFTMDYDSKILANVDAGIIAIKASGNMQLRDRAKLEFVGKNDPSAVRFDVMGDNVNIGYDVKWNGILTAPNALVKLWDRVIWNGALYANRGNLGMDVVVNASVSQDVYSYTPNATTQLFPPKSIKGFALYAKKNLFIDGQSRVVGRVGTELGAVIAEGSSVEGDMLAWNNIELRSQSSLTGSAVVGGQVIAGYNVNWSGNAVPLPKENPLEIGEIYTQIGTRRAAVPQGGSAVIEPGVYESLVVGGNGTAILQDGFYYFGSVSVGNGAKVELETNATEAEMIVSNQFVAEHNVRFNAAKKKLVVKVAGTSRVQFGNDCVINGVFVLPNADFYMGDRSSMRGTLWAQNISFAHQVSFVSEFMEYSGDIEVVDAPYSSDWIIDATNYKNNGSARMGFAEDSYIANAEYWGLNGGAVLKQDSYFKNGEGTISAWVYFDGAEGNCFASSNDASPNWKLERTLEGNLVFKSGTTSSYFPVPEQSWVFLTLTVKNSEMSVYVNGDFVKKITVPTLADVMTPWFGVVGNGLFKIDELRYSDVALSKDWIRMDYVTQKMDKTEEGAGEYAFVF